MTPYKSCARCVMDTSAEEITFNEKGLCNFCITWDEKERERKAWKLHPGLHWTIYEIQKAGKDKKYDTLIGLSGGVDSAMVLHYAVKERGLRPLCFSIDNGWNDPKADENIMRMVEKLKVPFFRYTIDLEKFVELQIAFVRSGTKNLEIPTDHILMASTYEMARKYNIKYILSGGNHATEGIMPESWGYNAKDLRFIRNIYTRFLGKILSGLPLISLSRYLMMRFLYQIKIVNFLDFYEYNREESKKLLAKEYGWKDYHLKHEESVFTKWFQNYYLPVKWGIDKRRAHFSSMICSGQMTKAQALEELRKPLLYPDLGNEEFREKVLKYPKKDYKDYPNNERVYKFLSKIYGYFSR